MSLASAILALILYVIATVLLWRPELGGQRARWAAGVGALLHVGALLLEALTATWVPGFAESLSAVGLGVVVATVTVATGSLQSLGRYLVPVGAGLLALSLVVPSPHVAALADARATWLLPVHLGLVFAGVAGFIVEFGVGLVQGFVRRRLKAKRFAGLERLPPLDVLDTMQFRALVFGLACLGAGVVAGVVWAAEAMHHGSWAADPKLWVTVVVWGWYAASLGVRQAVGFHGRWSMLLSTLGFVGLLFSMVGLEWVTGGFHAYGR